MTKSKQAPSLDEVKAFFKDNNYSEESAKTAWQYYEDGNWKDSSGKPVLSWKQKMRVVWFREEFKVKDTNVRKVEL